jgi:hypothetical protein
VIEVWTAIAERTRQPLDHLREAYIRHRENADTPTCCWSCCWHRKLRALIESNLRDFRSAELKTTAERFKLVEGNRWNRKSRHAAATSDVTSDDEETPPTTSDESPRSLLVQLANNCNAVARLAAIAGMRWIMDIIITWLSKQAIIISPIIYKFSYFTNGMHSCLNRTKIDIGLCDVIELSSSGYLSPHVCRLPLTDAH